jgi:hypothetical protein
MKRTEAEDLLRRLFELQNLARQLDAARKTDDVLGIDTPDGGDLFNRLHDRSVEVARELTAVQARILAAMTTSE